VIKNVKQYRTGRQKPEAIKAAKAKAARYNEDLQETLEPQEIEAVSEAYINECIEAGKRPTMEGLAGRLGVTSDVLKVWSKQGTDDKDTHKERRIALKKAADRMSDTLQQGKDPMSIFLLKQPQYGGFADKQPEVSGGDSVHIKVSFGGKKG
jgi:hypothetical protein